jgi:hypothetical protein
VNPIRPPAILAARAPAEDVNVNPVQPPVILPG